jgi:hypothetical protein
LQVLYYEWANLANVQGSWRKVREGYRVDATGLLKNKGLARGELQLACNSAQAKNISRASGCRVTTYFCNLMKAMVSGPKIGVT